MTPEGQHGREKGVIAQGGGTSLKRCIAKVEKKREEIDGTKARPEKGTGEGMKQGSQ